MPGLEGVHSKIERELNIISATRFNAVKKKKKKDIFIVSDGLLKFNVHLPFTCVCKGEPCKHILYVLHHVLGYDALSIYFIINHQIWEAGLTNSMIHKRIYDMLEETNDLCRLCLGSPLMTKDRLNTKNIMRCEHCKIYIHISCMNDWLNKNNKTKSRENIECFHCKKIIESAPL